MNFKQIAAKNVLMPSSGQNSKQKNTLLGSHADDKKQTRNHPNGLAGNHNAHQLSLSINGPIMGGNSSNVNSVKGIAIKK